MAEEKNKGGRPIIVLSEEQCIQIEALAAYLSLEQVADYLGIAKVTFYEIMERQPDVSVRYKRGKANAIGSVATSLIQKARDGDTSSAIFYLKTQAGWKEQKDKEETDKAQSLNISFNVAPANAEIKVKNAT